jgi:hypothetical protein
MLASPRSNRCWRSRAIGIKANVLGKVAKDFTPMRAAIDRLERYSNACNGRKVAALLGRVVV